ncbi:MAG: zinc ABC transporter substrate-binding protein [Paracoccaceae bacterium]
MRILTALCLLFATTTQADAPRVVTSIAPLQGLVSEIMAGVGVPLLLLDAPSSSHHFALPPSKVRAISQADIVFTIGLGMEPWLQGLAQSHDPKTLFVALGEIPALHRLAPRELGDFAAGIDEHEPTTFDPHLWLEPENVLLWIDIITGVLTVTDRENTTAYHENADRARLDVQTAANLTRHKLADMTGVSMLVTHDSLQYFEVAFGLNVIGAFSASDGQQAGAKTTSALLETLGPRICIVEDTAHPAAIVNSLPNGFVHVTLDPMGYDILGPKRSYPRLLASITDALLKCRD